MKNNTKKFIPSILTAAVVLIMAGCSAGSRGDDASSDTTNAPTTTVQSTPTYGSFFELRKTCTDDDTKVFNRILYQFNKYPKKTDKPTTAPFKDELKFILADSKNVLLAAAVAVSPEASCLQAFVPFLPPEQQPPSNGGGHGNGGGNGSGASPAQPTAGGNNCSSGNIDPDGTGPRGCEPTVPSDVGAGGGTPTQPTPPPAVTTTEAPATTEAPTESTTATTQPVVILDNNGQPTGGTTPPAPTPTVEPTPGECWIIDGVKQGNCD
jgi:hypothetical protein